VNPYQAGRLAAWLVFLVSMVAPAWAEPAPASAATGSHLATVEANDNRRPAGALDGGTLRLALRAGVGTWKPEGPDGVALQVEALGEVGRSLTAPAPLIRVVEGTQIVASVRNDLDAVLAVHGLCARDGSACAAVDVPPHETRDVRFASGRAGTYHYWASAIGAPIPFREMAGALVVDPPDGAGGEDRILVITEYMSMSLAQLREVMTADDATETFVRINPSFAFMINGRSWPATERFEYQLGETVRWRVINLSSQLHPMHLHGFYFEVTSLGDGLRDAAIEQSRRHPVVTQLMPPGGTMTLAWTPEREGNWLFHCHIMRHVAPERRLTEAPGAHAHGHHADSGDASGGMAGMILGVTVHGPGTAPRPTSTTAPRKLTLTMQRGAEGEGGAPSAGFSLTEGAATATAAVASPGPALVLRRNEPVEITLVNNLSEPTAIHWHGIELDSFYDGVHGWSGSGQQLAPMIEPGGTFVVRFTPPRAGTFIYHTHLHDFRQLSSGLYGPVIVTEPGDSFDPATDHVFVLGRRGMTAAAESMLNNPESVLLNGERSPRFAWKGGQRHRVRLINITPDDIFVVAFGTADSPVPWTPVSKDGAALPPGETAVRPARQTIAVGETYEFEYDAPPGRKTLWLEVRSTGGRWQVQGQVLVK
jgi:FtsP/CotA-like multicopper oxidase with cupredoxin domain